MTEDMTCMRTIIDVGVVALSKLAFQPLLYLPMLIKSTPPFRFRVESIPPLIL